MNPADPSSSADLVTWTHLLPLVLGPALVAALLTAMITVTLHLVSIRRENKYRFTADRRAAYVELVAAEQAMRAVAKDDELFRQALGDPNCTVEDTALLVLQRNMASEQDLLRALERLGRAASSDAATEILNRNEVTANHETDSEAVEVALMAAVAERSIGRRAAANERLQSATAAVRLLAPPAILDALVAITDLNAPETGPEHLRAMEELVAVMRTDLGIRARARSGSRS